MQDFLHKVHFFLIWVVSFRCALFTRALGQSSFLLFPFSFRSFLSPLIRRISNHFVSRCYRYGETPMPP
ncbi:hypothetical protein HMPREF0973_03075 [Prevotella veroralis F0319]|uniref:Uncharacterized protein n=1 Tax=Prevotella veroralis F0319 TaxID=649761 RepID=C9MTU7_9BACT|nr:hypothetical protein HMPREF0973_03075 [Prevotella veroralis F0319]